MRYLFFDTLADCQFTSALTNLGNVGTGETDRALGEEVEIDVFGDWCFAQIGLENLVTALLVRQRNIDQLVQTTGTKNGRVNNIRAKNITLKFKNLSKK